MAGRTLTAFHRIAFFPAVFAPICARYGGVLSFLLLSGCSGGPSGDDIKATLQEASTALLGSRMASTFEQVTNVNCKEAQGKPGYICSFNATSFSKMMNSRSSQVGEARFVQNNSKWVMMADK
jgi:hypothetical protein